MADLDVLLCFVRETDDLYTDVYRYHITFKTYLFIEGSLEVKLPTIWTDEKQRWEESERREE